MPGSLAQGSTKVRRAPGAGPKPGWRAGEDRPAHGLGLVIVGDVLAWYPHGTPGPGRTGLGGIRVLFRLPVGPLPGP